MAKKGEKWLCYVISKEHLLRGRNYVLSVGSLKEWENIGVWTARKMSWYDVLTSWMKTEDCHMQRLKIKDSD